MKMKLLLTAAVLLGSAGIVMAAGSGSQTFTVSATVPSASSVSITPSSVNSTTNVFTTVSGTSLSFDPLNFDINNANNIFKSSSIL